ncbi:MAG: DUF4234 domain-containing protein [Ruminococcus sp.]|nr:DUF4234 domain-containing protein [Ruminococcus sp.]
MKRFEFLMTFILSYVTCGIYGMYMFYVMTETNNQIARNRGVAEISGFIKAVLLGCVTCGIYTIYWMYKFAEQQVAIAKASGVQPQPTDSPIVLFLINYVPVYSFYVLCDNYNRTVDAQ